MSKLKLAYVGLVSAASLSCGLYPSAEAPPTSQSTTSTAGLEDGDTLEGDPSETPTFDFPAGSTGDALRAYFSVVAGAGPNAESDFYSALTTLRGIGSSALTTLTSQLVTLSPSKRLGKVYLVQAIGYLVQPGAVTTLRDVATTPLPTSVSSGEDLNAARDWELVARFEAVKGLLYLVVTNTSAATAQTAIGYIVSTPSLDYRVRMVAVHAYMESGKTVQQTQALLAAGDYWMTTDVDWVDDPADAEPTSVPGVGPDPNDLNEDYPLVTGE